MPENIVLYIYIYISHSTHQLTSGEGQEGGDNAEEGIEPVAHLLPV